MLFMHFFLLNFIDKLKGRRNSRPCLFSIFLFCLRPVIRYALLQRFLYRQRQGIRMVHWQIAVHMENHQSADAEADSIRRFIRNHGRAVVIIVNRHRIARLIRIGAREGIEPVRVRLVANLAPGRPVCTAVRRAGHGDIQMAVNAMSKGALQ